jgi:hypothetical protein
VVHVRRRARELNVVHVHPTVLRPGRRAATVGAAAAGTAWIGVAGLLARSDAAAASVPIGCPFKALTGLDCPGCGSTRSLGALTRFDLPAALDHNVLVPFALVFVLASFVAWTAAAWRRPDRTGVSGRVGATDLVRRPGVIVAIGMVFVAFAVVRNLELGWWLASGLAT